MSFIKKIWKKGNKLTVKELNRIETGIEEAISLQGNLSPIIFIWDKINSVVTTTANYSEIKNNFDISQLSFIVQSTENDYYYPIYIYTEENFISIKILSEQSSGEDVYIFSWTNDGITVYKEHSIIYTAI